MVAPAPIPERETERVAALRSYAILDTKPDERFDLFTRMGTWLYNAPVAAINFVDADRTFFKSLIGFAPYEPRRCTSICAHAVGGDDEVMVVDDLQNDSRFHDHPLVSKGLRFYAGAVLKSDAGLRLGTLCISDTKIRQFSAVERQRLREMAGGVGAALELHRNSRLLHQAATRDQLTGLCNRHLFTERLGHAIAHAQPGRPCSLLFLDLDGFKQINDTLGHAAGDAVLCEAGRRLTDAVRRQDCVARLGGDEFAILVETLPTVAHAEQLAQRVLDSFAVPFSFEGDAVVLRGSIGIALFPNDARDAADLLRRADSALYAAKQAGRGCYRRAGARVLRPILDLAR